MKVLFSVIINFISFMIKGSSLLEVQVFYYLSAGQGIVSLRYVLGRVFNFLLVRGNVDTIDILLGLLAVCAYPFLS